MPAVNQTINKQNNYISHIGLINASTVSALSLSINSNSIIVQYDVSARPPNLTSTSCVLER